MHKEQQKGKNIWTYKYSLRHGEKTAPFNVISYKVNFEKICINIIVDI